MWKNEIRTVTGDGVERLIGDKPLGAVIRVLNLAPAEAVLETPTLPAEQARIALVIREIDGLLAELRMGKRKKDVEEEEETDDEEEDEDEDDLEEDEDTEDDFDEEDEDEFEEEFEDDELDDDDDDIFYDDDDDE